MGDAAGSWVLAPDDELGAVVDAPGRLLSGPEDLEPLCAGEATDLDDIASGTGHTEVAHVGPAIGFELDVGAVGLLGEIALDGNTVGEGESPAETIAWGVELPVLLNGQPICPGVRSTFRR